MAKGDVLFRQEGNLGLLDFPRDVTAQTRETAYSAYNELARARIKTLALNFATTDYMNSAGIGLVISLVEDATQAGRRVFAFGLTSHYRKLFNYAGLLERVTLATDEQDVKKRITQEVASVSTTTPTSTTPMPTPSAPGTPTPAPASNTPTTPTVPSP
jgi:anti-anti-sigma factor